VSLKSTRNIYTVSYNVHTCEYISYLYYDSKLNVIVGERKTIILFFK